MKKKIRNAEAKCELLCKGIKDEIEGQKYYKELHKHFKKEEPDAITIVKIYEDEVNHEGILRNIARDLKCECIEYKLPEELNKEKRIKIAKGIWKL